MYEIMGNEIRFSNGKTARFEHPISQVIQFDEVLVVRIWPPIGTIYNENILGIDLSGDTLWQIEPQYPATEDVAYGSLENVEGYAVASNIKNLAVYLNPATGEIVKREHSLR